MGEGVSVSQFQKAFKGVRMAGLCRTMYISGLGRTKELEETSVDKG
jgi:hypothetical protein